MKVGLLGFGKTGKAVASVLLQTDETRLQLSMSGAILFRILAAIIRKLIPMVMHESITRKAFGNGVLFAARHIGAKEAGLYSMEDLLLPYFNTGHACG